MKIVVFGAGGRIGQRIVKEALSRGHQVKAVVRDPAKFNLRESNLEVAQGDATDPASVAQVVRGSDAVVTATGPNWEKEGAEVLPASANALREGMKRAGVKRLIVVGGAGSLEDAPGVLRMDMPDFPEAWQPLARAGRDSLNIYRGEQELDWTYFSPANLIEPGTRTGHYRTGTEQLVRDANDQSLISMEDYAVALLDELENPKFIQRRFTVGY